ncbi:MAG: cystathionine beta-lyase/cystathionine gamma-synthase [Planctomycetota bacterium]|nr:cystathionine beta-lyase/cystathionine gamma-synthase [Planctomycetota bacterium]
MSQRPRPETICVHPPEVPESASRPLSPPIHLSAVYKIAGLDQIDALYEGGDSGYTYRRDGDANSDLLAAKVAELEHAEDALICASGMGAEAALFLATLSAGDEVALSDNLYGKTVALVGRELSRFGVGHHFFDATRPESLKRVLTPTTRLVFVETLSNPLVRLADIAGLAEVAHSSGASLAVDHTFAPLLCRPIEMGADFVTHSLTKLIGGHSDLILGLLAGPRERIARAKAITSAFGLAGNPFESWLALRGVATLGLRSQRACATALRLAERLAGHPGVKHVHYPGLSTHPDHACASRTLEGGFGTIATIDVGGRPEADLLIRSLTGIPFAPSLGDASTTLSHPATTSHRNQSPDQWARQGISAGLIRLSFGLEDPDDLWDDLKQALDRLG